MGRLKSGLRRLLGSSRGFTLAEVVISVGLLGLAMGLMGGGIFEALGISRYWRDDVVATREIRHAVSWFSTDAFNAQTTDLVDGATPLSSVTLNWIDENDVSHSASYSLVGNRLTRNYDGDEITVARRVVSAGFSRSGQMLKFSLTVDASRGGTDSKSLEVYGRVLQ